MPRETNRKSVAAIYSAFKAGDMPRLLDVLADDVVWDVHGAPDLPMAGSWAGKAAVAEWFDLLGGTSEVTLFEIEHMLAEGDLVAVFGRESGIVQATSRDYAIAWRICGRCRTAAPCASRISSTAARSPPRCAAMTADQGL